MIHKLVILHIDEENLTFALKVILSNSFCSKWEERRAAYEEQRIERKS